MSPLSFEAAQQKILESAAPLSSEPVPLLNLGGRILAEDLCAPLDLPRWDNSEMDGFAVQAADCHPSAQLKVVGYVPAGEIAKGVTVGAGTAVRIMTGAPIPAGCDAIVPIENTDGGSENVTIQQAVGSGDFIRYRGSDIAAGEIILKAGALLRPAEVNLLAAFSLVEAPVFRRPTVAILSTGDELVPPGDIPASGQIIDSNSSSLAAAISEIGAVPQILGIARDDRENLAKKISAGLQADALITSAGISVGDRDFVRETLGKMGVQQLFWKVSMKPGGPTAFGLYGDTLVFSVPGNPVSSMIAFEELVRPVLLKMMGWCDVFRPLEQAQVKGTLCNETRKTRFLRVKVEKTPSGLVAESAGHQNTGILSTMIRANAIAILSPEQGELTAGDSVNVQLLQSI